MNTQSRMNKLIEDMKKLQQRMAKLTQQRRT